MVVAQAATGGPDQRIVGVRAKAAVAVRHLLFACVSALAGASPTNIPLATAAQNPSDSPRTSVMRITIEGDGQRIAATLEDSATACEFAGLLPLSLTLRDHAGIERIADLPRRLSREGAPAGVDPEPGDITYYAPWGNLAIFHGDFGYSPGLIRLGRIDHADDLRRLRALTRVSIEPQADGGGS